MKASPQFRKQLEGYGLTTAEILYRLPDHPSLLQSYIWQDYDLAPDFPQMTKFLDFWRTNLDGDLHSVRFSHKRLIGPNEWRKVDGEFNLDESADGVTMQAVWTGAPLACGQVLRGIRRPAEGSATAQPSLYFRLDKTPGWR